MDYNFYKSILTQLKSILTSKGLTLEEIKETLIYSLNVSSANNGIKFMLLADIELNEI